MIGEWLHVATMAEEGAVMDAFKNMSYANRRALIENVERSVKMATTYLRKAENMLHFWSGMPVSPLYWTLLDQAIETATEIVEALPASYFESEKTQDFLGLSQLFEIDGSDEYNMSDSTLELAQKLVATIEARREREKQVRLIMKLENTVGRLPEEAEAFQSKATELRRKLREKL
jgi:hypothetical protein